MNWIKDFDVFYNGDLIKDCVSFVHIVSVKEGLVASPRMNGYKTRNVYVEEVEILYIGDDNKVNVIRDKRDKFTFTRKKNYF